MNNKEGLRPSFVFISPNLAKPKRSASRHLEMIIAFLMFFTFVTFLLVYINPFKKSESIASSSALETIKNGFEDEFGAGTRKIFLKIPSGCNTINLENYLNPGNISFITGKNSYFDSRNLIVEGGNFYAYFSNNFTETAGCENPQQSFFSVGSIEDINIIFLGDRDYNFLKNKWGISDSIDFRIEEIGGDFVLGKEIPKNTEIFAERFFFESFDEEQGIKIKEFLFKTW